MGRFWGRILAKRREKFSAPPRIREDAVVLYHCFVNVVRLLCVSILESLNSAGKYRKERGKKWK